VSDPARGLPRLTRHPEGRVVRVEADGFGPVTFTYEEVPPAPGSPPEASPGARTTRTNPDGTVEVFEYGAGGRLLRMRRTSRPASSYSNLVTRSPGAVSLVRRPRSS